MHRFSPSVLGPVLGGQVNIGRRRAADATLNGGVVVMSFHGIDFPVANEIAITPGSSPSQPSGHVHRFRIEAVCDAHVRGRVSPARVGCSGSASSAGLGATTPWT